MFPHTKLPQNNKFYPYLPLKACGDGMFYVKKMR